MVMCMQRALWHCKMAQNVGVKVLLCHSHLVWLVFEGSIPTHSCFNSETFPVFLLLLLCCLLGMVREVGGEAKRKMHGL